MSRRAVLGAAVGVPLSSSFPQKRESRFSFLSGASSSAGSEERSGIPDQVRDDGDWNAALAAFRSAQAQIAIIEATTAGGSVDEEEAWLPAHGAACDAAEGALARAIAVPAPDLGALAVKLELVFAQAVEPGAVEPEVVEAVMADSRRLLLRGG